MGEAILDDVRKAGRLLIYWISLEPTELNSQEEQNVVTNIIEIVGLDGLNCERGDCC